MDVFGRGEKLKMEVREGCACGVIEGLFGYSLFE